MANATDSIHLVPFNKTKMLFAMRKKGIFSVSALLSNHAFHRCYATMCQYFKEEQMPIDILEEICRFLEADLRDTADSITDSQYESAKNGAAVRLHPPALIECYPANILAAALGLDRDDPASNVELAGYDLRPMYELDFLTERERQVMSYRFYDRMALNEVAAVYNVTRERVRQIEAKALRKIRGRKHNLRMCTLEEVTEMIEQKSKGIDDQGIEKLDLSVRTYNCLIRKGIKTIGDIKRFDQNQGKEKYSYWQSIRNMGKHSLDELRTKMREKTGYKLTDIYGRDN